MTACGADPAAPLAALAARQCFQTGPPAPCNAMRPLPMHSKQYVFILSTLCHNRIPYEMQDYGMRVWNARTDQTKGKTMEEGKTMECAARNAQPLFLEATRHAVTTLQATGAKHGITVLVHASVFLEQPQTMQAAKEWFASRNVAVCSVPGFGDDVPNAPPLLLRDMYFFIKLHLWQLTRFEQVAFYDSDHLFLRNPDAVFDSCRANLCMKGDSNLVNAYIADTARALGTQFDDFYWNVGFFVLRPNASAVPLLLHTWADCLHDYSQLLADGRTKNVLPAWASKTLLQPSKPWLSGFFNRCLGVSENQCLQCAVLTRLTRVQPFLIDIINGSATRTKAYSTRDAGWDKAWKDSANLTLIDPDKLPASRAKAEHAKFWRVPCKVLEHYFAPELPRVEAKVRPQWC